MKRIMPYYKDENLSPSGLGYSSMKSALKYMKLSKQLIEDFKVTLPKNYWDNYSEVFKLKNPWSPEFKRGDTGVNESGGRFYIVFFTKGWADVSKKYPYLSLSKKLQNMFMTLSSTENEEEYKEILYKLLRLGYYPHLYQDERDYVRKLNKFIKANVDFREVELTVNEV